LKGECFVVGFLWVAFFGARFLEKLIACGRFCTKVQFAVFLLICKYDSYMVLILESARQSEVLLAQWYSSSTWLYLKDEWFSGDAIGWKVNISADEGLLSCM